ncbi:sirohydrochlorin cobaltochelatase [Jingyaoa shaoxingensis]|uniref:sirohydrochlorin cobaltochelatase n=1 Tax=Jingyaoa shaoxingensis TaxID=2763671 RepID=UPI002016043D|nr:sirohydrochlorin cobaltochelatase [Jingyaoa shaoxingensis]
MKRKMAVVLSAAMVASLLTGCGGSTTKTTEAETKAATEATTEAKTEAETTEAASEEATTEAASEAETTEAASEEATTEAASEAETTEAASEEATTEAASEAETTEVASEEATEKAVAVAASTASEEETTEAASEAADDDQAKADEVADLIDAIYVQERTDDTDEQCKVAKEAWDALTDEQKELVEGENADPDYFGRDTGDASKDDPLNGDEIGENELLVVSFGTSFNDSRTADIGGIEKALAAAYPDWSVRRAFTAQIIINHVEARDDEYIDNMQQALDRAVENGVKNLVVQPTHLMHGAEYDELKEAVDEYADKFDSVEIAEPLLGEVGADAEAVNDDKEKVAESITAAAVAEAGYDDLEAAKEDGTAFVFMGHGTSHTAKISYSQMQTQMNDLGYDNVFIGTVEGEPEETACEAVIEAVKEAGYKKVVLRPLMVVAGDHANNDMAGDDEDSWKSQFEASGAFDSIDCQIAGLGEIADIQQIYVDHTAAAIDEIGGEEAESEAASEEETTEAASEEETTEAASEEETTEAVSEEATEVTEEASEAASEEETTEAASEAADDDQAKADEVADLIDAIYVQERTDNTDEQCKAAKEAWDALTDEQKELVEGENADPDYFGRDTGDASKDDPLNGDEIGENELLVVSFGTSFNDSRTADIGGIEKALAAAYPDWSVRRAFTAQIIINHVEARDDEYIDNMQQALDRAVENGVKNLVVQPTHLMHGAEYDELKEAVDEYADKFDSVEIAEPLLGEVGADAEAVNDDKEKVAESITAAAVAEAGYDDLEAAKEDGTAFVFMGHGTSHTAKISYSQMQTQMNDLGYDNVFIGTVEGEPEETACEAVIEAVKEAGYKKVVLRPLMVVAGDHANNDMAGDDEDSWKSQFEASGAFDSIDCQIAGLGEIADIQQIYVDHTAAAIDEIGGTEEAESEEATEAASEEETTEAVTEAASEEETTEAVTEAASEEETTEAVTEATSEEETTEAATEKKTDSAAVELEDGTYTADFDTDSSMFHANEACDGKGTLTVKDGEMTFHVSLASKNIVNLFVGTAEDAQKDGAQLLEPTTDEVTYSDGTTEEVYGFDIPVPGVDEEFDLALLGTKGTWYDHVVSISNPEKTE